VSESQVLLDVETFGEMILEFFSPEGQAVIIQSWGQGWGRVGGGVAQQPGMGGERGYIRGFSTLHLGW